MKKIVFVSLMSFVLLPWDVGAQNVVDDLYFVPSKKENVKEEKQEQKVVPVEEIVVESNTPTTVYASSGNTTVVIKDRKGNMRFLD